VKLDALGRDEAAAQLRACCGSGRWVERMIAVRPFGSAARAREEADRIWNDLSREDWLEAFDHHPRIGERKAAVTQDAAGAAWSSEEQAKVTAAGNQVKAELARVNDEYERRFGYIYIVCAAGKSADELLTIARGRLGNDPNTELRVAGEEQRKIIQLRLTKLLEKT
jgi:2-oxo-4-hydroxy-4-carboxy-5-ureidoimidazoline decarboxylase